MDVLSGGHIVAVVKTLACDKLSTFCGEQAILPFLVGMSQ
jgi:hypothetical protein